MGRKSFAIGQVTNPRRDRLGTEIKESETRGEKMLELSRLKDTCAIVGVGETPYTRGTDKTTVRLHLEAAQRALKDAGLNPQDIDDGFVSPAGRHFSVKPDRPFWPGGQVKIEGLARPFADADIR